jgi:peptidoglycan hydrolase-like protein with peptidoglycan-binding domain
MSTMRHHQAQSNVPPPVDSETVRHVQQALSDQGHKVNVDGIWGDRTHEALKEYQSDKHLNASGQLDGETFAALGLTEGAQQTASASSSQSQSPSSSQQSQDGLTQQQRATEQQQAKIESSNEESSPSK